MNILLSSQENGGLRVVSLRANKYQKLKVSAKSDFFCEGKENYIQKIFSFEFQRKSYISLARKCGLFQLYEETFDGNKRVKGYKLYKNWKHSNMNSDDQIVDIGFINDRYLYSCSREGKLILRDLLNDDANGSYRVFYIQDPVHCISIRSVFSNLKESYDLDVAATGKDNELKLYKLCLHNPCTFGTVSAARQVALETVQQGFTEEINGDRVLAVSDETLSFFDDDDNDEDYENDDEEEDEDFEDIDVEDYHGNSDVIFLSNNRGVHIVELPRNTTGTLSIIPGFYYRGATSLPHLNIPFQQQQLQQRQQSQPELRSPQRYRYARFSEILHSQITRLSSNSGVRKNRISPYWTSRTTYKDKANETTKSKLRNWIVSVKFVSSESDNIICGTQFGEILLYNTKTSNLPIKRIVVSQFAANKLEIFNNQNCPYIVYTDSMSKIGILNFNTFQQVNSFSGIYMGPISSSLFVFPPQQKSKRKLNKFSSSSDFDPIIFITSTIDKRLLIYKLLNNNTKVLIKEMIFDSLIPSLHFSTIGNIKRDLIYQELIRDQYRDMKHTYQMNCQESLEGNEVKRQNSQEQIPKTLVELNEFVAKNSSQLSH